MNEAEAARSVVDALDIAVAEKKSPSEKRDWESERWAFGSLPRLDLLHLYGRQFPEYSESDGLFETMTNLKHSADGLLREIGDGTRRTGEENPFRRDLGDAFR